MQQVREFFHQQAANGVDCYLARADAFKIVSLRIVFSVPLSEKLAAQHAILPGVIRRACSEFPGLPELTRYCEELYGTTVKAMAQRVGRHHALTLSLSSPAPQFVSEGFRHFERVLKLAYSLIARPLEHEGGFDPEIFASQQEQLARAIRSQIDEKSTYALRQAIAQAFPKSPYGVPDSGSEQAVMALDAKRSLARYREVLLRAPLAIYLSGPLDPKKSLAAVARVFGKLERAPQDQLIRLPLNRAAKAWEQPHASRERTPMEQAIVVQAMSTGINASHRAFAALRFADAIYGRLSTSRLFRVVREDHGLAYAVSSTLSDTTGVSFAWAGCDPAQVGKTAKLMRAELARLVSKGFSEAEFEAARNSLIEEHLSDQDQPGSRISSFIVQQSIGRVETPDDALAALRAVTPKQVAAAFARYQPRLEYRLLPE